MKDKLYFFTLGFMLSTIVSMFIITMNPEPKTELICGGCKSPHWYSVIADDE